MISSTFGIAKYLQTSVNFRCQQHGFNRAPELYTDEKVCHGPSSPLAASTVASPDATAYSRRKNERVASLLEESPLQAVWRCHDKCTCRSSALRDI